MKKFWIQLVILLIVIFGALYVSFNFDQFSYLFSSSILTPQKKLQVKDQTLNIELADTASKRAKGLGGRESLPEGWGMLFVFPQEGRYRFWMKGVKFPLDFVFIKEGGVVDLLKNIPPPQPGQSTQSLPVYEPVVPVNMVLEVNSGFVDKYNIKVGDQAAFLPE